MMVVFDLDDTLYKEADFVASGRRAIERYLHDSGMTCNIDGQWTDEMLRAYREHKPMIVLSDDAKLALDKLRANGIDIGIITDGRTITQTNKIEALGLRQYINDEDIIISESIGADKTTPTPFVEMMHRHPQCQQWLYIGDNPAKDFHYPNLLGWHTAMLVDQTGRNIFAQGMPDERSYWPQDTTTNLYDYISTYIRQYNNAKDRTIQ